MVCEAPLDAVILVGKQMREAFQSLSEDCVQKARCFKDASEAARYLQEMGQERRRSAVEGFPGDAAGARH